MRNIAQVINPAKVMVFITGLLFATCLLLTSSVIMLGNVIKSYESNTERTSDLAFCDENYKDKYLGSDISEESIDELTTIIKDRQASYYVPRYISYADNNSPATSFKAAGEPQLSYNNNQFVILPAKKFNPDQNQIFGNSDTLIDDDFAIPYRFESSGKLSNKRNIGDGKLFLPLYQDDQGNKLLFADVRGRFDNIGSSEYNIGIGFRRLINGISFLKQDSWILGVYGFIDHLNSKNNNSFYQNTLGIEALSDKYDFRANFYLPHSKEKLSSFTLYAADKDGDNIREYYEEHNKEKPFIGADIEFGYKLPIDWAKFKLFAGQYYFRGEKDYSSIIGHRVRAEVTFDQNNFKILPQDLEFTLGGEYQTDKVRGQQMFAVAKVSYQFGGNYKAYRSSSNYNPNNLKNRMNEFLIRDIDIVTAEKKFDPNLALASKDGIDNRNIYFLDANDSLNQNLIDSLPENSIIILDGSKGGFNLNNNSGSKQYINLKPGQLISTGSTQLDVTSTALNGKKISTLIPSIRASIESNVDIAGGYLIGMNNNTGIENVTINQNVASLSNSDSSAVINVDGKENVYIKNVSLTSNANQQEKKLDGINIKGGAKNIRVSGQNFAGQSVIPDISGYQNAININSTPDKQNQNISLSDLYITDNKRYGINIDHSNRVEFSGNITVNKSELTGINLQNVSEINNSGEITISNGYNKITGLNMESVTNSNFGNLTIEVNYGANAIEASNSNIAAKVITITGGRINIDNEEALTYSKLIDLSEEKD